MYGTRAQMNTTTIPVSELSGPALDWAVAKCEGWQIEEDYWITDPNEPGTGQPLSEFTPSSDEPGTGQPLSEFTPSSDWFLAGPIIERIKGLEFKHWLSSRPQSCCEAHIHNDDGDWIQFGPTLLTAAMRVYVASKLGDTVDVPSELL